MRIIGYGARGYIPTSMPYHLAVEAVRYVEAGGTFVPAGNFLPDRGSRKQPAENVLTERQMKVVEAVSHGFANKQIAHRLKMSENTVKVHLRSIMKKLNVRNRTEVAIVTRNLLDEFRRIQIRRQDRWIRGPAFALRLRGSSRSRAGVECGSVESRSIKRGCNSAPPTLEQVASHDVGKTM